MVRHASLSLLALLVALAPNAVHAAGAQMSGNRLSIGGTDISESITVDERTTRGYWANRWTYVPGDTYLRVRIVDDGSGETLLREYFPKEDVVGILVTSNGGNDTIELNTDVGCGVDAGWGDDVVLGGSGDDFIDAGPGLLDVIDGRGGSDVLYSGHKPYFGPLVNSPYTMMRGGPGLDTFVYRNSDYLQMDDYAGFGWMIAPDYTYGTKHEDYPGMHVVTEQP